MTKTGFIAALLAATVALTPIGAFATSYHVFGSSNKNYHVTVPDQNAPVNAYRYYGGPKSTAPHGTE